jgi:tetratricopeptide (TPR) repeat protein
MIVAFLLLYLSSQYHLVAQIPAEEQNLKEQLRSADSLYQQGRFQEAQEKYLKILSVSSDSVGALAGVGKCYLGMGSPQKAVPFLSEAVRRRPDDREAKRILAHIYVDMNQFGAAESLLNSLLALDGKDKESWYFLGLLMYENGYYRAADADLERSIDPASTDQARHLKTDICRAVCWVHMGRTGEAEVAMIRLSNEAAAEKDPDLLLVFAQLLYETQRPQMALQRVEQALRARPELAMGYFWKGKVLYRLGRLEEAASAAEQSSRLLPQLPYPRSLLVKIYQGLGRKEEALEQAEWLRRYEDRLNVSRPQ